MKKHINAFLIAILMLSLGLPANTMEKSWLGQQLIWATQNDDLEKVKDFLKSGAPVNEKDEHEMTALMWAARYDHQECCEILLKSGALANEKGKDGLTALIYAAQHSSQSCCEILLKYGASVNQKDDYGWTALMYAASDGDQSCCETLLKYGASVHEKDKDERTPLMHAAWDGHQSCCEVLLKSGASVNEKNIYGKTALMLAAQMRQQSCCEMLVEVMLGIHPFYTEEASATLFCMKEIHNMPPDKNNFDDLMEPIAQRLCFAQKMSKEDVLAEVNKIENDEIKQALIKKYFSEYMKSIQSEKA